MSELGSSSINLSGCPRFPAYSVDHSSFAAQQNPTGFGPQVPWGPSMGFLSSPPPWFPLRYSQVVPIRGEEVYNPASGKPVINDDPKAEIKMLHQQLVQAQEKQAALNSQINQLVGIGSETKRGVWLSESSSFRPGKRSNIRQIWKDKRCERRKEKGSKLSGKHRKRHGKKGTKWELQEREWGWAKELEKKKREWEREQKWEWEARSNNGDS